MATDDHRTASSASKPTQRLRNVTLDDVSLYERLRCDPAMTADLGGPQPKEGIPDKVREDVTWTEADRDWVLVIESSDAAESMGSVCIWTNEHEGERISEIGWMVLPKFQGRGVAKRAVAAILERARADGRWGVIHAFPAVSNGPSNGICQSLGFALIGQLDYVGFSEEPLRCNHWQKDPAAGRAQT
jgi:RimJ/RimL family protein N-acetyltransferase